MKQKLLLFFLIAHSFSTIAQGTRGAAELNEVKGVVVDENDMPVPYVNVWFEKGTLGTTSEGNGTFSIAIKNQEKQLIFSALGYQTKIVPVDEAQKVVLKAVDIQLEEVSVKRDYLKQAKDIGYYESGGFRYHIDYFISGICFKITEAERLQYPFIKEIKFKTLSENKNAKIRIYLVEANPDGSPGENKLTDEIILEVKKGNSKNIIDCSDRRLAIPENGFFVVFEKLKIEQNKHFMEYTYKDKDGKKTIHKGMSYEPEIPLAPVKDAVGWYKRTNNKWEKNQKTMLDKPKSYENLLMRKYHDKYLVPSVNITISN